MSNVDDFGKEDGVENIDADFMKVFNKVKLQCGKQNLRRVPKVESNHLGMVQVAKPDSEYFYSHLSIIETKKGVYIASHGKDIPTGKEIEYEIKGEWEIHQIHHVEAMIILDAIDSLNHMKEYNVTNYSFLVGYCLAKGLDLIDKGYLTK